ncbi:MAG: hypothetical protein IPI16_21010 [Comamonadaceae bacterium]|nr:hypothetical protein [Comamonadaceae bacterium]
MSDFVPPDMAVGGLIFAAAFSTQRGMSTQEKTGVMRDCWPQRVPSA